MHRATILFLFLATECRANPGHGGPLGHLHDWGWEHIALALVFVGLVGLAMWKTSRSSFSRHAALAALAPIVANAQQTGKESEVVEVIGRYSNNVGEWDAASQGVVTQEGISKRPLLRNGEVLEAIPGMIVTQHSGEGKANQYFLRGYNLDHGTDFAVTAVDTPINLGTHAHGQGYLDLNFLVPELIARVVYQKGPYAAADGDFASAGSARIDYADRLPASIASLTAGAFGYRRLLVAGSPQVGSGNLLYALESMHNDGSWDRPDDYRRLNGVLRYSQGTASDGWRLTAMGYNADWFATDQVAQRAVDSGLIGRYGTLDSTDGGSSSRYSLSGQWRSSIADGSRNATFYLVRSRLSLFSNFTYFLDDPVNGDQFQQSEQRTYYGGTASQSWVAAIAGHESVTTVGLQARRDNISPVALRHTVDREYLSTVREDRVISESLGPYASNTFSWLPKLRTIAGLRYDSYRFRVDSDNPANSGTTSDSIASPKITLALGPWDQTEYFVNYGRGFHSNDARGTTTTVDPATGANVDRVSPLVRTEGYELGMRSQAIPGVTTSFALWELKQDSELLFVGDAGTTEPSRPSRRRGVEWLSEYVSRKGVAADISLALTQARFADSDPAGSSIPGAPDKVASAGVTAGGKVGWSGSIRWRYFGPRPLIEDNSVRSQSTSLVNAKVGYGFEKRMAANFEVLNLFNSKQDDISYYYQSQLRGEAAPVADIHFHPVERRAWRMTFTVNF
jgi:hypothetical protein